MNAYRHHSVTAPGSSSGQTVQAFCLIGIPSLTQALVIAVKRGFGQQSAKGGAIE
jgi:hypothetical protein